MSDTAYCDTVSGHGKPVDMWALGVISYFLLAGYTPFDRDSTAEEMRAIVNGDYAFKPEVYWAGVSDAARNFINQLLTVDVSKRMTAAQALQHPWLATDAAEKQGEQRDLLPDIKSAFNAKRTFRKAVHGIRLINRLRSETADNVPRQEVDALRKQLAESGNVRSLQGIVVATTQSQLRSDQCCSATFSQESVNEVLDVPGAQVA